MYYVLHAKVDVFMTAGLQDCKTT